MWMGSHFGAGIGTGTGLKLWGRDLELASKREILVLVELALPDTRMI